MRNRPRTQDSTVYGGRKARRQVDQAHNTSAPTNMTDTAKIARDAFFSTRPMVTGELNDVRHGTPVNDGVLRFRDNRWSDSQGY